MLPVVKAGAYGHGSVEVARLFESCGPAGLAVAFLEEGAVLREAGIVCPILVMGGLDTTQIPDLLHFKLTMTVSSVHAVGPIEEAARRLGTVARVHAKVDTGMGRMGVRPEGAAELFGALRRSRHAEIEAVYSHFATADEPDPVQTLDQIATFRRVVSYFGDRDLPCRGSTWPTREPSSSTLAPTSTWCGPASCSTGSTRPIPSQDGRDRAGAHLEVEGGALEAAPVRKPGQLRSDLDARPRHPHRGRPDGIRGRLPPACCQTGARC